MEYSGLGLKGVKLFKMDEEKKEKIKEYTIRIGEKLRKVLDQQKKQVEEATYDCVKPSDLEVGEIIAKKVLGEV